LHTAAVMWVFIAWLRPKRSEFLWGGLLWGALGVYYFTSSEAWSLTDFDLTTRVMVRQSAGAISCVFSTLFASSFAPSPPRARPWLVGIGLVIYVLTLLLPIHQSLALTHSTLSVLGLIVTSACMGWYLQGARAGHRVARQLALFNLPTWVLYSFLLLRNPMYLDWIVLPSLAFFVLSTTIILVAHHAALSDRYELLLDRAHDAVLVVDRSGTIRETNQVGRTLFGRSGGSAIPADGFGALRQHLARGAAGRRVDLEFSTEKGPHRTVESVAVDLDDDEVLLIARDVTGRANAERSLVNVSRMETVGVVAGGLVHDLNNALTRLLAHIDALKAKAGDEDEVRLEKMADDILRAARTGRQVAHIARDGAAAPAPTPHVGEVVRDTASWMVRSTGKAVRLACDIGPDLPAVATRPSDIEQIVVNLVGNAIHTSPEHGTIRVRVAAIGAGPTMTGLELSVEDEGGGVPEDMRARIWEPFFTTRPDGTGIGLAVVARIARDLGGEAGVENIQGGARFFVRLRHRAVPTHAGPTVAVIAADADRKQRLRAMLIERGFLVDEPSAETALFVVDATRGAVLPQGAAPALHVRPPGTPGDRYSIVEPFDAEALAAAVRNALFAAA
jgi:signal transduction histidine kinase